MSASSCRFQPFVRESIKASMKVNAGLLFCFVARDLHLNLKVKIHLLFEASFELISIFHHLKLTQRIKRGHFKLTKNFVMFKSVYFISQLQI